MSNKNAVYFPVCRQAGSFTVHRKAPQNIHHKYGKTVLRILQKCAIFYPSAVIKIKEEL